MKQLPRAPRVNVAVTADLIEHSKTRDSSHCMIAEAVKAAFPDAAFISVDLQTVRFTDLAKGLRYTYLTPRVGQVALIDFDQGSEPDPFSFQLRNGQVTRSGSRQRKHALETGDSQQENARQENLAKGRLAQQKLVQSPRETAAGKIPDKVGGRTPPTTPFAKRRAYGLRALAK